MAGAFAALAGLHMVAVLPQDVLVHRTRLDVLVLLLEVLCKVHQIGLQLRTRRYAPQAFKRHVQLPLALQGQAHHAVRLLAILVRIP